MKLTDIKRTAADKKAEKAKYDSPSVDGYNDYPHGLRLRLNDEVIKKLKLDNLDADQPVEIMAEGFVSEDAVNKRNGASVRDIEIQITKLAVMQEGPEEDKAETLYGGGDADK